MITELSNEELITKLSELHGNERKITLEVLLHLIEFDNRKLFLNLGYSSLFDYCTRKLGYSEGSAYRRITGARCFKAHHALGKELSMESVLTKLLKHYLKKKERKSRVKNPHSRYVSASIRREVNKRDGSQCCFRAPDGTRCLEKAYLEFDHVKPFALGGETNTNNLRLLCASHNKLLAEQVFGKTKIESEIHRHQ